MREDIQILSVDQSEIICPICYQIFSKPIKTSCGHKFCVRCITQWTLKKKQCPCCRKQYSNDTFYESDEILTQKVEKLQIKCLKCNKWNGQIKELKAHRFNQCSPFQTEIQSIQYEVVEDDPQEPYQIIMQELLSIKNQQNYIKLQQFDNYDIFQKQIPVRKNKIKKNRKRKANLKQEDQEDEDVQFLQEDDINRLKQSKCYIKKQIDKRFKLQNDFLKEIYEQNYKLETKCFVSQFIYYRNLFLFNKVVQMQF